MRTRMREWIAQPPSPVQSGRPNSLPCNADEGSRRGLDSSRDRTYIAAAAGTRPTFAASRLTPTHHKAKFPVRFCGRIPRDAAPQGRTRVSGIARDLQNRSLKTE